MRPLQLISPSDLQAYRIAKDDRVMLAVVAGPQEGLAHTTVFEVWEPGAAQPPNRHPHSTETFLFLAGAGVAHSDGASAPVRTGDLLVLPPGTTHKIENPGPHRLHAITTMVPDDGFAALITAGVPADLDPTDLDVLRGHAAQ